MIRTRPIRVIEKPRPDKRVIIFARCEVQSGVRHVKLVRPDRWVPHAVQRADILARPRARVLGTRERFHGQSPAEFWRWIERVGHEPGRSTNVLLVLGDANRELALLGWPEGYAPRRSPLRPSAEYPRTFMAELRNGRKRIDVMQLANWHPEGIYATELGFGAGYTWLNAYVDLIRSNDLGPKICVTLAQQALTSYRRFLGQHPEVRRPWWHVTEPLYRFEYEVQRSISPVRIEPTDGHHERLWYFDFTAFYLSILASRPMPEEVKQWHPRGLPRSRVDEMVRLGALIMAEVTTTEGERRLLATPSWRMDDVAKVERLAVYRRGHSLAPWAEHLFRVRETCDPLVSSTAKALGVALWGRLSMRNRAFQEEEWDYAPGDEAMFGRTWTDHATGAMERFSLDGEVYERCDPAKPKRERWLALGAHVMSHGRSLMAEAMARTSGEIVYAHTDSIWSTEPVVGTAGMRLGRLGGCDQRLVEDVEFRHGCRIIGGNEEQPDSAPGRAQRGTRRYRPFDETPPGMAVWEERQ